MSSTWSFWEKFAQQFSSLLAWAFSSPLKGLIAPICAWRILCSGVALLALLTGAELTYYHRLQSYLGSEQKQTHKELR